MADEAAKAGDAAKVAEYTAAAESFANRLIALEHEVEGLKELALQAAQASDQAKAAVQQNSSQLQKKLSERQKLLSQLDQAKMQEQVNKAMASLSETVGQDVPTFDEVRDKIEARYAKAKGASELQESSVESRMLEVEQAAANTEAQARLAQIRAQLGLGAARGCQPARAGRARARRGRAGRGWHRLSTDAGVGPHPRPWPEDARLDPALLRDGDRRNVVDRYRYWRLDAIVADLDRDGIRSTSPSRTGPATSTSGRWCATPNAFLAASVHIVGNRRWNRRGAMVTDRYQHVLHHPTIGDLVAWAGDQGLPLVGIDNLPGPCPWRRATLPERVRPRCSGRRAPASRRRPPPPARSCTRSPSSAPPDRSTPGWPAGSRCTPESASTRSAEEAQATTPSSLGRSSPRTRVLEGARS